MSTAKLAAIGRRGIVTATRRCGTGPSQTAHAVRSVRQETTIDGVVGAGHKHAHGTRDQRLRVGRVVQVCVHVHRFAAGLLHQSNGFFALLSLHIRDDVARAFAGEAEGGGASDARSCAGDDMKATGSRCSLG